VLPVLQSLGDDDRLGRVQATLPHDGSGTILDVAAHAVVDDAADRGSATEVEGRPAEDEANRKR
jgi:hypothetical protein